MKFVLSLLCGILLTGSNLAHAGIWYKWHATNHVAPQDISLLLEFDVAVVKSGAFQMHIDVSENAFEDTVFPQSGLLSFYYGTGTGGEIAWRPRKGITDPGPVILEIDLSFGPGRHLTGGIYAHNYNSQFGMSTGFGGGPNFTLYEAESDAGMNGCGWVTQDLTPCFGATGQIRQIPEPASVALFGLGALGAIVTRRRSARQRFR